MTVGTTGNHYALDIAAGLLVSALGYVVGRVPERLAARRAVQALPQPHCA